jgi:hypothetical protein
MKRTSWALAGVAVPWCILACGCAAGSAPAPAAHHHHPAPVSQTADSAEQLSVSDACGEFRTATSEMSAAGVTNLDAMRQFGDQLAREGAELMNKDHPDPGLANALGEAGAANLAVAIGYLPDGLQAGLNLAAARMNAVGDDCSDLGY